MNWFITSLIRETAEMNRLGAYMLTAGEASAAHAAFDQARLKILRALKLVNLNDDGIQQSASKEYFEQAVSSLGSLPCPSDANANLAGNVAASPESNHLLNMLRIPKLQDDKLYIYNYAMTFCADDISTHGAVVKDLFLYSASILFNLALCDHLRGKRMGDPVLLSRAATMYRDCVNSLLLLKNHTEDSLLLYVVALNNSAQIYHESNPTITQESLKQLSRVATALSLRLPVIQTSDKNELVLNVLLLSCPNFCYYYGAPCA